MCSLVCASEQNVKQSDVFPQVEETFSPKCASNVGQLLHHVRGRRALTDSSYIGCACAADHIPTVRQEIMLKIRLVVEIVS